MFFSNVLTHFREKVNEIAIEVKHTEREQSDAKRTRESKMSVSMATWKTLHTLHTYSSPIHIIHLSIGQSKSRPDGALIAIENDLINMRYGYLLESGKFYLT